MDSKTLERLDNIQELDRMLDVVANQSKDEIISGKKELVDAKKHSKLTFSIKENDKDVEITKDVYEVITSRDGMIWHELYDDQGNLLNELSDEQFQKGKLLTDLGEASFDENSLMAKVYDSQGDKSLSELENEQSADIADALGMKQEDVKTLDIVKVGDNQDKASNSEKLADAQRQLAMLANIGFTIDTNELANSKETIREFLNIDADNLLIVKVNSEWKALKVNDNGSIEIENNLQIADNSKTFSSIGRDGHTETRQPTVEFRRKDNPDYSLAIDTNKENKTQAFLVAGESRTASEIEAEHVKSPYADVKNNELLIEAEQNPNEENIKDEEEEKDIHEPDEPSLEPNHLY